MEFRKQIKLKNGCACLIRNGTEQDAEAVLANFILTHGQTEFLTSYPDEITLTVEKEREYLKNMAESEREAELLAVVDGKVAGTAGIYAPGKYAKVRHRASFGISIDKSFWNLGIGRALTNACIECAKRAGYSQLELDVVAANERAVSLYKSAGFIEYGRNPNGFRPRNGGKQELILMRLELE